MRDCAAFPARTFAAWGERRGAKQCRCKYSSQAPAEQPVRVCSEQALANRGQNVSMRTPPTATTDAALPDSYVADLSPTPSLGADEQKPSEVVAKRRPQPGERRSQILQALASMLEAPTPDRITTAGLAARLQVSEAALYRHFASKAQMFDALLDFIEQALFERTAQIVAAEDADGRARAARIVQLLLQFGERNPGLARVLCGDALLLEHERLQQRANQVFERLESLLRQCLRAAAERGGAAAPTAESQVAASVLVAFCQGRLQRFARSQFKRLPTEQLDECLARML